MISLLQTQAWVDFKVLEGWRSYNIEGIFVLEKKLPLGKSFLYAPEISWEQAQVIASPSLSRAKQSNSEGIAASAFDELRPPRNDKAIFLRLEILDENNAHNAGIIDNLKKAGFIKAFEEVQPEWRQVIDISQSEEEILAQMKPKGRYNIRVAEKHGCKCQISNSKFQINSNDQITNNKQNAIDIFYDLYRETAQYQKISIRDKKYFEDMIKTLSEDQVAIIIVEYQGKPLSGLVITFYDKVASYLYGGTSREHKEVMAPYLAHWEAIREAKRRGCIKYDLLAVSPDVIAIPRLSREKQSDLQSHPEQSANVIASKAKQSIDRHVANAPRDDIKSHKYDNLTRFKEQFGGRKIHITGSWDYVFKPGWYKVFRAAERLRRR